MQHIAKEGRCFVVSVNQFCQVSDFPSDYPPFDGETRKTESDGSKLSPETILSHGGSCVVGPLGTFVAEPLWDRAEIVYADLCMSDLAEGKVRTQLKGHMKPDICLHIHRWISTPLEVTRDQISCM